MKLLKVSCFLDPCSKSNKYLNDEDISNVKTVDCSDGVLVVKSLQTLVNSSLSDNGSVTIPPPAKREHILGSFFKDKDDTAIENNGASTASVSPEQKLLLRLEDI